MFSKVFQNCDCRHFKRAFSHRVFFYGKMPDSFKDFFLQTTHLTVIGLLFTKFTETTTVKTGQCKLDVKGPPFVFFKFFYGNLL